MKFRFGVVIFPKFRCDYQCRTLNFIEQGAVLIQFLFFLGGGGRGEMTLIHVRVL